MIIVYIYDKNTHEYIKHYIPNENEILSQIILTAKVNKNSKIIIDNFKEIEDFIKFIIDEISLEGNRDFVVVVINNKKEKEYNSYKELFDKEVKPKLGGHMVIVYVYDKNTHEYISHYIPDENEKIVLSQNILDAKINDDSKITINNFREIEGFIKFIINEVLLEENRDFVVAIIDDEKEKEYNNYKELFDKEVKPKLRGE